mmetsp:Transcript_2653/g.7040  ORF Transcript_2653/g.7040 Transcript_2653/m.7040 type:complete len:896 (+) Transcript_2653:950-3637(+)
MVFAVLFEQLLPSHRGLKRNQKRVMDASTGNDGRIWEEQEVRQQRDRIQRMRWLWKRQKSLSINASNNTNGRKLQHSLLDLNHSSHHLDFNLSSQHLDFDLSSQHLDLNQSSQNFDPNTSKRDLPGSDQRNVTKSFRTASAATRPKRKRCKASKCLASLAADFDVVTDWFFYFHCVGENKEDGRIPSWIMGLLLASCILGTLLWLVLATDGALATPILRRLGYDKLSLGHVLFFCVLVEDVPQVILTFIIEECYGGIEDDEEGLASAAVTNYALINVVASLYDTLIKLAEAFDERTDVVETGRWCKESILVGPRFNPVLCVAPLPVEEDRQRNNEGDDSRIESNFVDEPSLRSIDYSTNPKKNGKRRHRRKRTLLEEATTIVADTKLPRIRFLTAAGDGSVRIWDTAANPPGRKEDVSSLEYSGDNDAGASAFRIKCIVLLPPPLPSARNHRPSEQEQERSFFLTGGSDGTVRLWATHREACLRSYSTVVDGGNKDGENTKITSLAVLRGDAKDEFENEYQYEGSIAEKSDASSSSSSSGFPACLPRGYRGYRFVTGHKSGRTRVWSLGTGSVLFVCDPSSVPPPPRRNSIAITVLGPRSDPSMINAVCSLEDGGGFGFATASSDGIVRVWQTRNDDSSSNNSNNSNNSNSNNEAMAFRNCLGHTRSVLALDCLSPGRVLVSASKDSTARLWSVSTGSCLRVFEHTNAVTALEVVDPWTVLTGTRDGTLRVWDALSADCIRTFDGEHSGAITSVSICRNAPRRRRWKRNPNANANTSRSSHHSSGAFCSASMDGTVKLWVFSAIQDEGAEDTTSRADSSDADDSDSDSDSDSVDGTLQQLLGVEDGSLSCMACQMEPEQRLGYGEDDLETAGLEGGRDILPITEDYQAWEDDLVL